MRSIEDTCHYHERWTSAWKYKCGDKCVPFTSKCTCGNTTLDFLRIKYSHHCCPKTSCQVTEDNSVLCPDGEVLEMADQCGDQCYNDWEKSEHLDPVNANFRCQRRFVTVGSKDTQCLPITEMCQGLDICGEVAVCNENLTCADSEENATNIYRSSTINRTLLHSKLTDKHYFCYYSDYFVDDFAYDYIDRRDEEIQSRLVESSPTVDYSALTPCNNYEWMNTTIDQFNTTCNCAIPGLNCPGEDGNKCVILPVWCNKDNKVSCFVGDQSLSTSDERLCRNYTFWRSIFDVEVLNFSVGNLNSVKSVVLPCKGRNQEFNLPWYYFSLGEFQGLNNVSKHKCDDKSDRIYKMNTSCDQKTYLQIYSDMFCRDPELNGTICKNLDAGDPWFTSKTNDMFVDPHSCQASCYQPALGCEACTNTDTHFICEESGACLHQDLVCDGHPQCEFGEDEALNLCYHKWVETGVVEPYASYACPSVMYPSMTTMATACNGFVECYDGSDESSCSDKKSIFFFVAEIIMIIILYTIIRYYSHTTRPQPSEDNHDATGHFILEDIFTPRENTDYNDFVTNHEKEDIIEKTNILLLRMIFSEKRDVIKGKSLLFYELVAEAKNNDEAEIFCYLHNNFDSKVVKEIMSAKFPGLKEKSINKIEKLFHKRFITQFRDKVTKNDTLDGTLSTLNTLRKITTNTLDLVKDSYLALYLLVISGGPRVLVEHITNFTSVIILCLIGTIILPIFTSSIYIAISECREHLVFSFVMDPQKFWVFSFIGDPQKWKRRTVAVVCVLCGPLNQIFLFHSLHRAQRKLKKNAKSQCQNLLMISRKAKMIKALLAQSLRIELGK